MRVVTHATSLEHSRIVSVYFAKFFTLMAIETTALKNKPATPAYAMTLSALRAGNRRMLVKGLKTCRMIWTHKEMHFLLSALPHQNQRVQSGARLQRGVQNIGKGLFGLD